MKLESLRAVWIHFFWSLNFHHSSLITHNSLLITLKYHVCLAPSLTSHCSIFFTLFVSPILITRCIFFFFLVPKLTEPSEKKQKQKNKKKNPKHEDRTSEKKKRSQKVVKSCGWVLFVGPLCVFNYNIAIELWVMETENSQNEFSVSITHNSKIRELSNGKRVIETELSFAKRTMSYGSHHFWVMSYGNWELSYGNRLSKQPLSLKR